MINIRLAQAVQKVDITLSNVEIAIKRTRDNKTNHAIRWIVIYPMDSVIHL